MNTQSQAVPEFPLGTQSFAAPEISALQRFYWSVRRELWENRSIYIAPLIAAGLFLFAYVINMIVVRRRMHGVFPFDPVHQHKLLTVPHEVAAAMIMVTAFIVGIFYSLDALYGERRDRSILFWKSLPVSDVTTVLAKLTIPMAVLPLLSFVVTVAAQFVALVLSSVVFAGSGLSVATLWTHSSFFHTSLVMLYHIVTVHGLWYAPFYGWLLLVSAWAPRAPFIWAFLPPVAIYGVERIAFNTSYFLSMMQHRLMGPPPHSPLPPGSTVMDEMAAMTLGQFLSEPGLWVGLAIAAVFLAGAVWLRRNRGPI
ncbi:MAG TPA: ABC transporter permease [Terriglobales bacterium]